MRMSGPERQGTSGHAAALFLVTLIAVTRPISDARADEEPPADVARATASIWDGVFTAAQARRGQTVYPGPCGTCHGRRLNGAPDDPDMFSTPPIGGAKFLRNWNGRTLAALFAYTRATMPASNPGFLTDQEFVDIIAYMLSIGGLPAGRDELEPDPQALARIVIRQTP
jgi:mono/diheme cytochrome c family protein